MKITIFQAGYCTCPEHLALRGGAWRGIPFPAMFALFEHPRFGPMLFDTGYSYRFFDETRFFPERLHRWLTPVTLREDQLAVNQLAARSLKPSDITRVFISHFHADHIAALADFNKATYVYLPQAYESVRHSHRPSAIARGFLSGLVPDNFEARSAPVDVNRPCILPSEFTPFVKGYDLLGDESLVAVELPGHAAGQMGLVARGVEDQTYFFVADAAWLAPAINEDRLPHAVTNLLFDDPKTYRATLSGLHRLGMDHPDVHLIPSHCAETLASFVTP